MIERRNFYRILHVQPDAPMAVITESYRVLMQKLNVRADLNSPDWNVSLLSIAYNTLRDPRKRAAYDSELLKRYHIRTLSQGALGPNTDFEVESEKNEQPSGLNQRNYYRILQVQPDAPAATIKASYLALKKNSSRDTALLDEAYRVLSDPATRNRYDALFVGSLFRSRRKTTQKNSNPTGLTVLENSASQIATEQYRPVITHYCSFCKTPNVPQASLYLSESCLECGSPLQLLRHSDLDSTQRAMRRVNTSGSFRFYLFWPGHPCQGLCQDLSPTGIRFKTEEILDSNDIIKIDAPSFQAVAEVTHKRYEDRGFSVGTRFIAVKFDQRYGNFVTIQV